MNNKGKIHILVAEDETLVRRLLVWHLARHDDFQVVGEARTGPEAIVLAGQNRLDVLLTDLCLPGMSGIDLIEEIRALQPSVATLMITSHSALVGVGRMAGTSSLDKACTPEELGTAIRAVYRSSRRAGLGAAEVDHAGMVRRLATRVGLTAREREVVVAVVTTELSMRAISHRISSDTGEPTSEAAVKHSLARAFIKLGVQPHTRAALLRYFLVKLQCEQPA